MHIEVNNSLPFLFLSTDIQQYFRIMLNDHFRFLFICILFHLKILSNFMKLGVDFLFHLCYHIKVA